MNPLLCEAENTRNYRNSTNLRQTEACTRSPGGAESGANVASNGPIDSDLHVVIKAWPTLPEVVRARILGIVEGVRSAVESKPCESDESVS